MRSAKIIIVDDNLAVLKTLRMILSREFKTVVGVSDPTLLPALLREGDVDVVLLDMNFGTGKQTGGEGLFWLDRIREYENAPEVVLITAFADIALAVASLKKGAADFIVKPWDNDNLIHVLISALEKKEERHLTHPFHISGKDVKDESDSPDIIVNQLVEFLLQKYALSYGKPFPVLTVDARKKLTAVLWSGNISLLEQCIERTLLLNDSTTLSADDFLLDESTATTSSVTLEDMEKQFISEVLREKKWNLTVVAQQLNISRQTLYNKMRKYGL